MNNKGLVVPVVIASLSLVGVVALAVATTRKRFLSSPLISQARAVMDNTKINVLVYSGVGTGERSRAQTIRFLKAHLGNAYAVQPVSATQLINEPWESTTALLVIPGGADLNYVRDLSGEGTRKIKQYVESGGKYMGICAGAYFAAREVQFEMGTALQVQGPRDLAFFPGVARGCVYPGFSYDTMSGCRAVAVNFKDISAKVYYNGGCQFDLDSGASTKGIEVLGTYADNKQACVVGCKVGLGAAVLIGTHPEYHPDAFSISDPYETAMLPDLLLDDAQRVAAMRNLLQYLELTLDEKPTDAPPLSDIYMVIPEDKQYSSMISTLSHLSTPYTSDCPGKSHILKFEESTTRVVGDVDRQTTQPVLVTKSVPASVSGFDSQLYYSHLKTKSLGRLLMCGQTVTSTQTILMDHFMTMKDFNGLVFTAVTQVSGRGRGNNVWVSPYGCMLVSLQLPPQTYEYVLYIEYILAISIVTVIKSAKGGENLDINIKWPNDVYYNKTTKISGILVSSNLDIDDSTLFHPVVGFGLNLWNAKPTTCVNKIIQDYNEKHGTDIPFFTKEELLAKILNQFEEHMAIFTRKGFSGLEQLYYKYWLHGNQRVTIEADGSVVVIKGLTKDGYLSAVTDDGKQYELHPDQNSFDLMQGLIKKKK